MESLILHDPAFSSGTVSFSVTMDVVCLSRHYLNGVGLSGAVNGAVSGAVSGTMAIKNTSSMALRKEEEEERACI